MQRLLNAAFPSSSQKSHQTGSKKLYGNENSYVMNDDRFLDHSNTVIQSSNHSKKPSFSVTSAEFSRQYNAGNGNQTICDIKSQHNQTNKNFSGDLSHSLLTNAKGPKPKEIEELFESTRNFYNQSTTNQNYRPPPPISHSQLIAQKENFISSSTLAPAAVFEHAKHHRQASNAHFKPKKQAQQHLYNSYKKPAQIIRIEKKMCGDDESLAFNSLTSYKKDRSASRSIDSPPSSNSAASGQKFMKARQFQLPKNDAQTDFQLFNLPQSAKSDNKNIDYHFVQFKNISNTQNNNTIINNQQRQQLFTNTLNHQNQTQDRESRLSIDRIQNQKQQFQQQFTSLDSQRYQVKMKKQQFGPQTFDNRTISSKMSQSTTLQRDLENPQVKNYQRSMISPAKPMVHNYQLNVQQYSHAIPKMQDKSQMPEAKRLSDDSNESIHSCDMSKSFSKLSLPKPERQEEEDIKFISPETHNHGRTVVNKVDEFGNKQLFSFNMGLLDSQRSHGSHVTSAQQLFNNPTNIDYQSRQQTIQSQLNDSSKHNIQLCSSNSARKRAKWDLSLGKQTLQNSLNKIVFNKGNEQPILSHKAQAPMNIEADSNQQIEMLQKQFLAIKKQLEELTIAQKKKKKNYDSLSPDGREETMKYEEVLSADNEISDSSSNSFTRLKSFNKKSDRVAKTSNKNEAIRFNQNGKTRQRKENNHFKSIDAQFQPINITSEQSPYVHHHKYQGGVHTINKESHHENGIHVKGVHESQQMRKLDLMKSQLQVGLRKLSSNKHNLHSDILVRKLKLDGKAQNKQHLKLKSSHRHKHMSSIYDCRSQKLSYLSSGGSSIDYKDCMSQNRLNLCDRKSSGSSKYFLANDDSLCSCCLHEEEVQKTKSRHHRQQSQMQQKLDRSQQKSVLKNNGRNERVNKIAATTAKKRRGDENCEQRHESKERKHKTAMGHRVEQERDKSINSKASRQKSKSHYKQRENNYCETPQFNQQILGQSAQLYGNRWNLPLQPNQNILGTGNMNNHFTRFQAAQYAHNLSQPQVIQNAYQQNQMQYMLQAPLLNSHQMNLPLQQVIQPQLLQMNLQNTVPLSSKQSPTQNFTKHFFGNQSKIQDVTQNYESNKHQIEAIETLIQQAKVKLDCNLASNIPQQCKMQESMIQKSTNKISRNQGIPNYQSSYNTNKDSLANKNIFQTHVSEFSVEDKQPNKDMMNRDFYTHQTFNHKRQVVEPCHLDNRKVSHQIDLSKKNLNYESKIESASVIENGDYTPMNFTKPDSKQSQLKDQNLYYNNQTTTRAQSQQQSAGGVDSTMNSNRQSIRQSTKFLICEESEIIPVQNKETRSEIEQQQQNEVLWIDFNEDKQSSQKKLQKRPALSSNQKQQQLDILYKKPVQIKVNLDFKVNTEMNEERHNNLCAYDQPQIISKTTGKESAWAMDFSNNEEANSQTKALRLKRLSMERRLDKSKEPPKRDQTKKDFTKQELLERKKELLKLARENIKCSQSQNKECATTEPNVKSDLYEPFASINDQLMKTTKVVKIDILTQKNPNLSSSTNSLRNSQNGGLMSRLSSGQKTEISKKDMLKLTSRNYEQLPEIQKKKIEEGKKEDLMKRIAQVKDLEKKRRETIVNKQKSKQLQSKGATNISSNKENKTIISKV